jgi:hypothetical protein
VAGAGAGAACAWAGAARAGAPRTSAAAAGRSWGRMQEIRGGSRRARAVRRSSPAQHAGLHTRERGRALTPWRRHMAARYGRGASRSWHGGMAAARRRGASATEVWRARDGGAAPAPHRAAARLATAFPREPTRVPNSLRARQLGGRPVAELPHAFPVPCHLRHRFTASTHAAPVQRCVARTLRASGSHGSIPTSTAATPPAVRRAMC